MTKHAYVTFIIRNDTFLPGALVFAYALKKQDTKKDLVCIVSDNISENARQSLSKVYDVVLVLEEIFVPHAERHDRQDRPFLFTRFNAFRLGYDGDLNHHYQKILIADADVLPIQKYDALFDLSTPAGIINEFKEYCVESDNGAYIIPDSVSIDGTWKWHEVYKDIPFGTLIPKPITDRVHTDKNNMGVNAALYLFTPSMTLFNDILADVAQHQTQTTISQYRWPEMQYITTKMSGKWHNMDLKYASFNGYPTLSVLNGIHYAGLKPWQINHRSVKHYAKYEDYQLWYAVFMAMIDDIPALLDNRKIHQLHQWITTLLKDSRYVFYQKSLQNLQHLFKS